MAEVEAIEEDQNEIDEKTLAGHQFKMKGFEVEEPTFPKHRAQTAIASVPKETELIKDNEINIESQMRSTMTACKSQHMFDRQPKKSILKKDTDWASKSKSKVNTVSFFLLPNFNINRIYIE